ncbi:unnamed protein product [Arabis nemorensis]|uniref:C2H2-type domain-containing protein n=1 Tax=Arabis nemorensis TaxID=586526 RepID=A0A565BCU7_9BRAS|nr:unnamed protein product [Arabis nemorensis]
MLITEDPDGELTSTLSKRGEYTVLPAFRGNSFGWENILKETPDLKTPSRMLVDSSQPRWFCRVCKFGCDTYPDFALHLYGYAHEDRLAGCASVPLDEFEIYQEYLDDLEEVSLADLLRVIELDDPLPVAVSGPSEKDASRKLPKPMLKWKNIVVSGPSEKDASRKPMLKEVKKVMQSEKVPKQMLKAKNKDEVKKVKQSEKENRKQRLKAEKEELLLKKKLDELTLVQMHFEELKKLARKVFDSSTSLIGHRDIPCVALLLVASASKSM